MFDDVFPERNDTDMHIAGRVLRVFGAKLAGKRVHLRLRLLERHPRSEPAEDGEEREVPRGLDAVVELQRFPELRIGDEEGLGREPQMKVWRHDPDDRLIYAVEPNTPAHEAWIGA